MIARRTFVKGASLAALAATTSRLSVRESLAQQVPNSSGTEPAKVKAPPGACDVHLFVQISDVIDRTAVNAHPHP